MYSNSPIFCVPTGVIRFCAASVFATSVPDRPRACSAFGSRSIWICACFSAERIWQRRAGHSDQLRANIVIAEIGQLLLRHALAR